jgi:hypothetical protein
MQFSGGGTDIETGEILNGPLRQEPFFLKTSSLPEWRQFDMSMRRFQEFSEFLMPLRVVSVRQYRVEAWQGMGFVVQSDNFSERT